jgi:glutathione synthase/RimK-type ligase-like ATP-grasp enzyme
LQRLVASVKRDGVLRPAQVLRAYIVDGTIPFWTERYRERIRRPSDFIVSQALGAKLRFLQLASHAADRTARRTAELLGIRFGAVDLIRSGDDGHYVLDIESDGPRMMIDRSFKEVPEFRDAFDFDRYVMAALTADE